MKISAIIINYNTKELTLRCARSLLKFKEAVDLEILVLDNGSDGDDYSFLSNSLQGAEVIESSENIGFAAGINKVSKIANGELLFFINSDAVLENNIFKNILTLFKDKKTAIVSPLVLDKKGMIQEYSYGSFDYFYWINKRFEHKLNMVDWVSGAAMFIRSEIFKAVDGFDDNFFMYFEDMDICRRVKRMGFNVLVDIKSHVNHLGGKSFSSMTEKKEYYYRSQEVYYKKYYGFVGMIFMKIIRFIYLKFKNKI